MKAILFGGTGMVGESVLLEALRDDSVDSVLVIGRKSCRRVHEKLDELIHNDFFDYSDIEKRLEGYGACFFCLGVSSVGMRESDYRRTTYDLTMAAAGTLSRLNPGMVFCYISGAGTDSTEKGRLMWARVKGKTENDLARLPFRAVYSFRPGFIKPARGQRNVKPILKGVTFLYPVARLLAPKYVCTMQELGRAMIRAASGGYPKGILENADIQLLGRPSPGSS